MNAYLDELVEAVGAIQGKFSILSLIIMLYLGLRLSQVVGRAESIVIKEAIELYCKMIEDQVLPNHFTFSSLFKACSFFFFCICDEKAASRIFYQHEKKHLH
ncbi:hypothetical protein RHMOL_Rhmol10G0059100 [Rhododendron molle]|uniref:Uncharacterized protein n=1 Tax=Rhododendron molle TaxID=49168 RepID=A0ACC0M0E1_RHOML|nr:hypothetical protein RHMOL_Rhmol10G0059100 [Rhododendron molle]